MTGTDATADAGVVCPACDGSGELCLPGERWTPEHACQPCGGTGVLHRDRYIVDVVVRTVDASRRVNGRTTVEAFSFAEACRVVVEFGGLAADALDDLDLEQP